MSDDSDAKQKKITSAVYLKILEEQMSTLWESDLIYMQDETSIHTACIIKRWLADNEIEVMNWSLYFPDLNLIKHVWKHLKEWIHEHYSKLQTLINSDEMIKKTDDRDSARNLNSLEWWIFWEFDRVNEETD